MSLSTDAVTGATDAADRRTPPAAGPRSAAAVPHVPAAPAARLLPGWRWVTPLAGIVAGALLTTSFVSAGGSDLRGGRNETLADLAREQTARVEALRDQVATLESEVTALSASLDNATLQRLERRANALAGPAGLTAVAGPGLTVTLDDAPPEVLEQAGDDVGNAIVHQQDVQAVANALWAGGAEAMTIQGQRVISTTGIKCVGNTVVLHGVPYSPPYVFSAIGDSESMRQALARSPYIRSYLAAVDAYQLGWQVRTQGRIEAPAYDGPTQLRAAQPAV